MRLLCPFCQKAITVSDSEAGKAVNCPECYQQFAAPQLYAPAPAMAPTLPDSPRQATAHSPAPETYLREAPDDWHTPAKPPELPDMPKPDREMSGYAHMYSIALEPKVVRFIPPVALFLAFVLTFFSWNGLYPAGYSAYTQSAWGAVFGSISRDSVADEQWKVGDKLFGDVLEERVHTNWWLVLYLLLLFPTLALAFAGPVVELAKIKLPPNIENLWQYRPLALGGLAVLTLLLLLAQWGSGFGLQNAVNTYAEQSLAEEKAKATTPEKMQVWEMRVAQVKGGYHAKTTPWVRLSMLLHVLAALAVVAEAGLMLRGKKPPPRAAVMW
jgi:hypothetical protein